MPVFLTKEHTYGSCPCCGGTTTVAKGSVTTADLPETTYWVRWSPAHPEHDMLFVIDLPDSKRSVATLYSLENGSFMVIGPDEPRTDLSVLTHPMNRKDVIGSPLAGRVFAYLDEIYLHDPGVAAYISKHAIPASAAPLKSPLIVTAVLIVIVLLYFLL